jgi:hypothetical protein
MLEQSDLVEQTPSHDAPSSRTPTGKVILGIGAIVVGFNILTILDSFGVTTRARMAKPC